MAEEDDVLAQIEQEGDMQLLGVDDEVEHEVEEDRDQPLEPLRPRDEICERHAQEGFHRS
jgi:hypothetical protein